MKNRIAVSFSEGLVAPLQIERCTQVSSIKIATNHRPYFDKIFLFDVLHHEPKIVRSSYVGENGKCVISSHHFMPKPCVSNYKWNFKNIVMRIWSSFDKYRVAFPSIVSLCCLDAESSILLNFKVEMHLTVIEWAGMIIQLHVGTQFCWM